MCSWDMFLHAKSKLTMSIRVGASKIKASLPSGNETWQWKIPHIPIKISTHRGFSIATFD
jgi:hypothetical protein